MWHINSHTNGVGDNRVRFLPGIDDIIRWLSNRAPGGENFIKLIPFNMIFGPLTHLPEI